MAVNGLRQSVSIRCTSLSITRKNLPHPHLRFPPNSHLTAYQNPSSNMTNPYANIEYVMANVVPIQNSIMSNINRGDLTAMYDAGIPTPISATVQRRNLQRARCSEDLLPPMTSARTCPNTSLDPLRMNECEGYWRDHPPRPEGLLPPLRQPDGYWPPLTLCDPHDGPHHVCEECRDDYRIQECRDETSRIASAAAVLCKTHSLAFFRDAAARKGCECYERLDGGWSCVGCRRETLMTLHCRAVPWKNDLFFTHVSRVNGRRVYVDYFRKARQDPACPIPECGGKPWMSYTAAEVMEMCLGCCAVQHCLTLPL